MERLALSFAVAVGLSLGCGSQVAEPVQPEMPVTEEPVATAPAPEAGKQIVIGERKSLQSAVLGEERGYLVSLPDGYDAGTTYPVIYLLDGDGHFHHVTGLVSFLSAQNRMPAPIIVGISNTDRTRDMTPTNEARLPTSGGGDRFLEFIEKELIPAIERDYKTSAYRILIGHSFGGLITVHAMASRPGLFNAHIAASPSLQWDGQLMAKNIAPQLNAGSIKDGFLYYSLGTEGKEITEGNQSFAKLLETSAPKTLRWKFDHMELEDHGSVVHRTVYLGLEMLYDQFAYPRGIETVEQLMAHAAKVRDLYRLDGNPPEGLINVLGYRQLQAGPNKLAAALTFFELNVKLYPDSANVHDSLGEALESGGRLKEALASYERAVANSKPGETFHEVFIKNRDRVAAELKKPIK